LHLEATLEVWAATTHIVPEECLMHACLQPIVVKNWLLLTESIIVAIKWHLLRIIIVVVPVLKVGSCGIRRAHLWSDLIVVVGDVVEYELLAIHYSRGIGALSM
jgi:hypothetical protein